MCIRLSECCGVVRTLDRMSGQICSVIVCMFMMLFLTTEQTYCSLPDFQGDTYLEDISHVSPYQQEIQQIQYDSQDMPDHCRSDVCFSEQTLSERRGDFNWSMAEVGSRLYLRCPYSVNTPVYGYRDCKLRVDNGTMVGSWSDVQIKHCPEPPLTEILKRIKADLNTSTLRAEDFYQVDFADILDSVRLYTDQPIYTENIEDVFDLLYSLIYQAAYNNYKLSSFTLELTFQVLDWMVNLHNEKWYIGGIAYNDYPKVIWMFTVILEKMPAPPTGKIRNMEGNSAMIFLETTTQQSMKMKTFISRNLENPMRTHVSVDTALRGLKVIRYLYLPVSTYFQQISFHDRWLSDELNTDDPEYDVVLSYDLSQDNMVLSGPVIYVSVSRDPDEIWSLDTWASRLDNTEDVSVTYNMTFDTDKVVMIDETKCAQNQPIYTDYDLIDWYGTSCDLLHQSLEETSCQCNGSGYHAVMSVVRDTPHRDGGDTAMDQRDTAVAVFLGFPYKFELYVASHVFRAMSLLCLILTVTSFIIHRKTRRGIPTKILLNLCGSLITLLLSLYVSEAISYTKTGCRISNILRYYLVMVTLLWNAVEAVNMYLMLIRVFNHNIQHFLLIAAGMAWGIPLLLMSLVFSISVKGFDGIYTDDCEFRCILKKPVLYYGFLLPLGIILAFNIVIFILVMRVLLSADARLKTAKEKQSVSWTRLCGAMSMMVLLGIPWIFSAFGAIDATETNSALQMMEGIFHAVFVVCVNLQGVFIFLFHCARNTEMRQQWKSTFSRSTSISFSGPKASGSSQAHHSKDTKPDTHPNERDSLTHTSTKL